MYFTETAGGKVIGSGYKETFWLFKVDVLMISKYMYMYLPFVLDIAEDTEQT